MTKYRKEIKETENGKNLEKGEEESNCKTTISGIKMIMVSLLS